MRDLIALARLRALLLELGFVMRPTGVVSEMDLLESWMRRPCEYLEGLTPMELLLSNAASDQERVANALKATIARERTD